MPIGGWRFHRRRCVDGFGLGLGFRLRLGRRFSKENIGLAVDGPKARRGRFRHRLRRRRFRGHVLGQIENLRLGGLPAVVAARRRASPVPRERPRCRSGSRRGRAARRRGLGRWQPVAGRAGASARGAAAQQRLSAACGRLAGGVVVGNDAADGSENLLHGGFCRFRRLCHCRVPVTPVRRKAVQWIPNRSDTIAV